MTSSYQIVVATPSPSNAVPLHDHPVLETGNLSFPDGRYVVDFRMGSDGSSCELVHHVEGAPLIDHLIDKGIARYACVVSSPMSAYRRICHSSSREQIVVWDQDDLGESPLFTPAVVCLSSHSFVLVAERDGVHDVWNDQKINLAKGARLALGDVIQLRSQILQLLAFQNDKSLLDGQFIVDIETEPFRFIVKLSSSLYLGLRFRGNPYRPHIMTHIVTACLSRLHRDFGKDDGEEGWKTFSNLKSFAEYLESEGHEIWDDPNFVPEKVATALYPHKLSTESSVDL